MELDLAVASSLDLRDEIVPSLGRFRRGDTVHLSFPARAEVLEPPTVLITADGGTVIGSHPLWTWDGLVFQADILLGSEYGVGTFTAEAVLTTGLGWDQTIRQS